MLLGVMSQAAAQMWLICWLVFSWLIHHKPEKKLSAQKDHKTQFTLSKRYQTKNWFKKATKSDRVLTVRLILIEKESLTVWQVKCCADLFVSHMYWKSKCIKNIMY